MRSNEMLGERNITQLNRGFLEFVVRHFDPTHLSLHLQMKKPTRQGRLFRYHQTRLLRPPTTKDR
jgi:hypothetical protein